MDRISESNCDTRMYKSVLLQKWNEDDHATLRISTASTAWMGEKAGVTQ